MTRLFALTPRNVLNLALAAAVALALLALAAAPAQAGGRPFVVFMTGAEEAPGPGDADGSGVARLFINPGQQEVCFEIEVEDITLPATLAHIHVGPPGVAGPPVVTLVPPDEDGTSSGCVSAERELLIDILVNPSAYYVNVHNADFPAGAVRGQMSR